MKISRGIFLVFTHVKFSPFLCIVILLLLFAGLIIPDALLASNVPQISTGSGHNLALKSDGTVWAWGYNEDGELGDRTNINKSTPVQIIGFSDVIAIAGGEYHSLALRLDGTVWAWGYNEDGQLGNGTNTDSNTPVQVNINLMVSKITSSIMLVPISDIIFGESVTITGQIIPAQQEARVIMTFTNSKGEIDTKTAESEVEGDFTLPDYSPISGGTWTVTASWEGNSDYSGAVSEPQTFIVNPAEIALTIETTSTIIQIDQTVDITGIVTLTPDNETTRNKFLQETLSLFRINPDGSYEDIILTQPFLEEDQLTYIFKDVKLPGIGKWKLFNVFYEDESFIGAVSGNIEIEVRDAAKEVVGYAILVEGRIDNESGIDSHNRTANYINEKLIEMKFKDKNIHYFNFDDTQTGVDGKPVRDKILKTITDMSGDINMSPAPLYIIFVGPGDKEKIFIDPDDPITAGDLKGALNTLESQINSEALEKSPMVIVFGANHSGSFINALSKIGKKRVIIASSDTEEVAYKGPLPPDESIRHGDYFVSEFFKFAARGMSLKKCYEATANEIALFTNNENGNGLQGALAGNGRYFDNAAQHPVIDDNGDGIGTYGALSSISNSYKDGEIAAKLVMGIETITSLELTEVTDVIKNLEVNTSPILFAKVNDSNKVDKVWIEIAGTNHRLSYHGTATVQQEIELPRFPPNKFEEGQYLWNDFDDNNEFNNFTDQGKYEIFYFGQDKNTGDATDLKISRVFRKAGGSPPPAFHAVYPVNGVKTAIALRFEWEINDNKTPIHKNNIEANDGTENEVVYYILTISDNSNFKPPHFYESPGQKNTVFYVSRKDVKEFVIGKTYFWRVIAHDRQGRTTENDEEVDGIEYSGSFKPFASVKPEIFITGVIYEKDTNPLVKITEAKICANNTCTEDIENDGTYELTILQPSAKTFKVSVTEANGYSGKKETVSTVEDSKVILNMELTKETTQKARIYGNVKDVNEDKPLEGVEINIRKKKTSFADKTITDNEGNYEFTDLESGKYKLTAEFDGYEPYKETIKLKTDKEKQKEKELIIDLKPTEEM